MKNEETLGANDRSQLEDRIIAHFDGSLDAPSSKSLMEEVMANPEKRALFRAHETLNRVIASARVPMEAPLETRREIAEKIPGLIAFIPGLIGTATTAPVIQQAVNPILAFFTRMSLTTAVSIGSAVAVLTTIGIIASNNAGNNSNTSAPKSAVVQSAAPSVTSQNYAMAPAASKTISNSTSNFISSRAAHHVASKVPSSSIPTALNNRSTSMSHSTKSIESNASQNVADNMDVESIPAASTNDHSTNDRIAPGSEPVTPVSPIANPYMEPKPTAPTIADIPIQKGIMTGIPDEVNEGITVRPFVTADQRFVPTGTGQTGQYKYQYSEGYAGGLEFEIGDRYAFRAQFGRSDFAQVAATATGQTLPTLLIGHGLTVYGPGLTAQQANWTTVGMSYSYPLFASAPLIVSADLGAAWLNSPAPMAMFGIGTEISVAGPLAIRPVLSYDVVNISTDRTGTVPNGGIYEGPGFSNMSVSSFGFQLNFVYRP
ncbi:MAG TPA: hypothetical protein VGM92_09415 [Candidatus Kapabacteria bacterium]